MAALYAHDLYGREVYALLPGEMKRLIREHEDCYYLGLQGPDPLFFYRPTGDNAVRLKGKRLHDTPAGPFYMEGIRIVKAEKAAGHTRLARAFEAYLLGFCCHYTLDSSVHGWVNYQHEHSIYTHTALETELDRRLLVQEGHDPLRTDRAYHIRNTRDARRVTARLFDESAATMGECIVSMHLINRVFGDSFEWFKWFLCVAVSPVKESGLIQGMFMRRKAPEGIERFTDVLEKLYHDAVPEGGRLLQALFRCMEEDGELPERLNRRFG